MSDSATPYSSDVARIRKGIDDLDCDAERLQFAYDITRELRISGTSFKGDTKDRYDPAPALPAQQPRMHSRAIRCPISSLVRRPARIISGW
jgi:hypothetical protein